VCVCALQSSAQSSSQLSAELRPLQTAEIGWPCFMHALYLGLVQVGGALGIFLAPVLGSLSDSDGRKPFLVGSTAIITLPICEPNPPFPSRGPAPPILAPTDTIRQSV